MRRDPRSLSSSRCSHAVNAARRPLALAVVLASALVAAEPVLLTGLSASGTWDSNVTRSTVPEGGFFFDTTAHAGGGLPLFDDALLLTAFAQYRGRIGATTDALSSHVLSASGAGSVRLLPWLRVGLAGAGGYTLMSDAARSGARADARGFFRASPLEWLTVRAGYGWLWRDAADPLLATANHEASAAVEARPFSWLELSVGGRFTSGGEVVYVPSTGSTPEQVSTRGWGGGRTGSGTDAVWLPVQTPALTYALEAEALFVLPAGFGVGLEGSWMISDNALQPWSGWTGSLVVSWDLP